MKVVELDQWSATGNVIELPMRVFENAMLGIQLLTGGDSEAAKAIFGGHVKVREVGESELPSKGYVWFKEGPNGLLERYRANYDSSD